MAALPARFLAEGLRPLRSLLAFACIVVLAAIATGRASSALTAVAAAQSSAPRRIISLIPATTEMLFDIGVSDRIIGVGTFDRFPPEVSKYPRVGGLLDPNVERILSLKPDLVVVYDTQTNLIGQLNRVGVPIFRYRHQGLPDIVQTIKALADRVGVTEAGNTAAARIEQRLADVRRRLEGRPRPRTLLIFGREPGSLRRIDASGGYGFLHDLLELAGGTDVLSDFQRQSVQMSTEMILARAPEVIIELQYGDSPKRQQIEAEMRVWDPLSSVPAVRNKRVHLLVGDEFVVPGPRIVLAAERFARALHPEAFK
jgi:iron complex transport system substrate-binding protein